MYLALAARASSTSCPGKVWDHSPQCYSHWGSGPALLLLGPALCHCTGKGWSQFCLVLEHQLGPRQQSIPGMSTCPLVVTWPTDFATAPAAAGPQTQAWPLVSSITIALGGSEGCSYQAVLYHSLVSSSASLYSAPTILLLFSISPSHTSSW